MKYCCKEFEADVGTLGPLAGVVGSSPPEERPKGQFEQLEDGTWAINGCCGGGCFVVEHMKFCPYCGANLMGVK